jgi:hypothetical protein
MKSRESLFEKAALVFLGFAAGYLAAAVWAARHWLGR